MIDFAQPLRRLEVTCGPGFAGLLERKSQYEFAYAESAQRPICLLMPLADRTFRDNDLFALMDINLPEGFLLAQIRERAPKTKPTKMHLLALMGRNGIGRVGYLVPDRAPQAPPATIDRADLLRSGAGPRGEVFAQLVDAYLSTGAGLSGVQPKIMVPNRANIPVPNLLVKVAGPQYPGAVANEYLCLEVARRAGLDVAAYALADDGSLLIVDRFDISADGERSERF